MITKYLQQRFALSRQGAKDLERGIFFSTLQNIALMLPTCFMFVFLLEQIDNAYAQHQHTAWWYAAVAVVMAIVMFIVFRLQYNATYVTVYNESANRRISLAEKLRRLPLAFFGERNLSDLTSTIMEDCTELEQTFSHAVPQLIASFISIIIIAACMFAYNWQMALALFYVVPFALLIIMISKLLLAKHFKKMYLIKRGVTQQIQEGLECVQEIKAYNGEAHYNQGFDKRMTYYEHFLIRGELLSGVLVNLAVILLKLGMPTVILYGAWLLTGGSISIFTYIAFLIVSAMVYIPIEEVCNNLVMLSYLDVRIKRIKEMEQMPTQGGKKDMRINNYDIEFKNVNFAYQEGKGVLENVSFVAKQGEVTALVGPSGGGKSTTAKLSARFWDINSGEILLGGQDISKVDPETLLQNFAIVFQDVLLFNASIADNIRIGKRDATTEEIKRVAQLSQCNDFIERMPNGYDTIIGENGETLSGGERQRLSIARALLKDAPIILLDEATASLDAENETKIQHALSELVRNKTVIVIAHRMRTIRNVNKVVVLNGGKVVEQGTPEELMKAKGTFYNMVQRQQGNL